MIELSRHSSDNEKFEVLKRFVFQPRHKICSELDCSRNYFDKFYGRILSDIEDELQALKVYELYKSVGNLTKCCRVVGITYWRGRRILTKFHLHWESFKGANAINYLLKPYLNSTDPQVKAFLKQTKNIDDTKWQHLVETYPTKCHIQLKTMEDQRFLRRNGILL